MSDHAASAVHHLNEAARYTPGSEDERYHSYTAATYSNLDNAAAQREQARVGAELVGLQKQFLAGLDAVQAAESKAEEIPE